jgi:hypothetical protein
MTSGSEIFRTIKGKIRELENQSSGLESEIYGYEAEIRKIVQEKEKAYVKLANIYLPELDAEHIQATLREVRENVENVFKEKQKRRIDLDKQIGETKRIDENYEKQISELSTELDKKASERDGLTKKVLQELEGDKKYCELKSVAEKARERLIQNEEIIDEVKEQAGEKIPEYEADKLFMYLLKREYGTSKYDSRGIIRRLDRWVAEKIRYDKSIKNYNFLQSMPKLMEVVLQKRKQELEEVVNKMGKIEEKVSDDKGLTRIIKQGQELEKKRAEIIEKEKQNQEIYDNAVKERERLDNEKGEYHKRAIVKLKSFLKGDSINELKERARATKGSEDDLLVDKIEEIDERIRYLKDEAKETKERRKELEKKIFDLMEIKRRFDNNDYEADRSYFDDDFNINNLLILYLAGKIAMGDLNSRIESSQHFKPRQTYSYSRGHYKGTSYDYSDDSDYSFSSPSSSGWGFGGGGFSSGGGFGGGGFSSGGGFGGGGFSSGSGF